SFHGNAEPFYIIVLAAFVWCRAFPSGCEMLQTARPQGKYMPSDDMKTEFRRGCRHGLPVAVTALPFAVLFGTLAVESGLGIGEAVFMSATVFAGASQMVGIELFGQHIAPWMIVFSIFAVNF